MKPSILPAGPEKAAAQAMAALEAHFPSPDGPPDLDELLPMPPEAPDGAEMAAAMMPDMIPPATPGMGFEDAPVPDSLPPLDMALPDDADNANIPEDAGAGDTLAGIIPVLELPEQLPFDDHPGKPGLLADLFGADEEEEEAIF